MEGKYTNYILMCLRVYINARKQTVLKYII